MKSGLRSPDEALLALARSVLAVVYRALGINPLILHYYPFPLAVGASALAFLHMGATVDPWYGVVSMICVAWLSSSWSGHASLRRDAHAEWDAALYKKYGGIAMRLRDHLGWIRLTIIAFGLLVTVFAMSDLDEMAQLATWHRPFIPLNIWALALIAYFQSAEPPLPGSGDFLARPSLSAGLG